MNKMYDDLGISKEVLNFCEKIEVQLKSRFTQVDAVAEYNQMKVLKAFQEHKIADTHFAATTGYGYNDLGRDALEAVYASVFNAEDALVRPQLISGTHALTVALSGNLRPGDTILSPIGKPYDTLEEVIGIRETRGSLKEWDINYKQVEFKEGNIDYPSIKEALTDDVRLVLIQRSKGYDDRKTLSVNQIGNLIAFIKDIKSDVICMVDNCYGEFVQLQEPSDVGADLVVGSLIKNPGGGLAPIGGYIVGKKEYVENAAFRLTAPGLGKEVGPTLGVNGLLYQGLFLAPTVVSSALKGAIFAGKLFESLGYSCVPNGEEERYDIIQAVEFGTPEGVIAFCEGIQAGSPIDSHVTPVPWDMPGYDAKVIMAAGAFIQGSSIELSADAPIKPPYTVFFQGGLTWYHAKFGIMKALQALVDAEICQLQ